MLFCTLQVPLRAADGTCINGSQCHATGRSLSGGKEEGTYGNNPGTHVHNNVQLTYKRVLSLFHMQDIPPLLAYII